MNRNIVLLTVDSLRADYCSFLGYNRDLIPSVDRMAKKGVNFKNAVAPAPFTSHSMPAIFTGTPVFHGSNGGIRSVRDAVKSHLHRSNSIPYRLSGLGYDTAGFTPNPYTSRYFGFDRGFDHFVDFFNSNSKQSNNHDRLHESLQIVRSRWANGQFIEGLRLGANVLGFNIPGFGNQSIRWKSYYDMIIEWINRASEPFFLWVFLLEPHSPYRPPRKYREETGALEMYYYNLLRSNIIDREPTTDETQKLLRLYEGTIKSVDEFVVNLSRDINHHDPIYVFHSDHGEAFGEHGNFGHTNYLYEENIHVPLVIANVQDSDTVSQPMPLSALPSLIESLATENTLNWEQYTRPWAISRTENKIAARGQDWKYIHSTSTSELFDLASDASERRNLVSQYRETASLLDSIIRHDCHDRKERRAIVQSLENDQTIARL